MPPSNLPTQIHIWLRKHLPPDAPAEVLGRAGCDAAHKLLVSCKDPFPAFADLSALENEASEQLAYTLLAKYGVPSVQVDLAIHEARQAWATQEILTGMQARFDQNKVSQDLRGAIARQAAGLWIEGLVERTSRALWLAEQDELVRQLSNSQFVKWLLANHLYFHRYEQRVLSLPHSLRRKLDNELTPQQLEESRLQANTVLWPVAEAE